MTGEELMDGRAGLERFLRTDPRDVGCAQAMELLHVYAELAAAGCDVAVIITQPGSKSQQNAQRQGFDLLYTRAVLVKQP